MTIELKIMGETAAEIMRDLREMVGLNPTAPIDFAAAKVQEGKVKAAYENLVSGITTQTYEPDTSDEAEVDPEIVQGEPVLTINEPGIPASENVSALDSAGDEWDEAIHSPNKTMTKDGRWRLKKGAVRPEPSGGATVNAETGPSTSLPVSSIPDEEDEFAAFAEAMAEEPVEAPEVMARTWTDADLSRLCNQAAQKMGNPAPIKDTIAKFVPEGEVPHSRNVPVEGREDFAQAIEKLAGIEYAG